MPCERRRALKLYEPGNVVRVFGLFYGTARHLESFEPASILDHLKWLNEWCCRHIAKDDHPAWTLELERRQRDWDSTLLSRSKDIRSLTETQVVEVGKVLEGNSSLSVRSADNRMVHFGATAASSNGQARALSSGSEARGTSRGRRQVDEVCRNRRRSRASYDGRGR
jgi:hypothetical protein